MPSPLPDLHALRLFLKMRELGTIAAAAESIGMSRTTARRKLATLEKELGALMYRTTSGVSLTEAGQRLAERSGDLLARADNLVEQVQGYPDALTGTVRVCLQTGLPMDYLARHLCDFGAQHPKLHIRIEVREDPRASLPLEADVALTMGARPSTGPTILSVVLRPQVRLLASEPYLAEHGVPASMAELSQHKLAVWECAGSPLELIDEEGAPFPITPWAQSNDMHLVREFARLGRAIAVVPDAGSLVAKDHLLLPLLAKATQPTVPMWLLMPEATFSTPRVQALLNFAKELSSTVAKGDGLALP